MNGPNDLDDGWAELARELGLENDRPFPAAATDHPAADLHPPEDPAAPAADDEFVEEPGLAPTAADIYADEAGDEPDDGEEADAEGEPTETGEPGEPRKKRRRRRRRKGKKPGDPTAAPGAEGELSEESSEAEESEESEEPAIPSDGLVEEEGATPAATRELIANWDVPSWETIVNTMLFRPQGR
ncbi:MAG: hypothetical protein MUF18_16375 [Fimbriiglobus sp.]|jgi:hypothetical protein|nr:hypothetical protein [Fimbriiglobus sp.]